MERGGSNGGEINQQNTKTTILLETKVEISGIEGIERVSSGPGSLSVNSSIEY